MAARPRILRSVINDDVEDSVLPDEKPIAIDPAFNEALYLRAFPDIAEAVRRGALASGLTHYRQIGHAEDRLEKAEYRALLEARTSAATPKVSVDALTLSPSGAALMTGWTDDRLNDLTAIELEIQTGIRHAWTVFPRLPRPDVGQTLDATADHRFGFLLVAAPIGGLTAPRTIVPAGKTPIFRFAGGAAAAVPYDPVMASDTDLRDLALVTLLTAGGDSGDTAAIHEVLDQQIGMQIAAMNRLIAEQAKPHCLVERSGPSRDRYLGSVITTLRGGAEQIVPRLALVASCQGAEDYEFIVTVTDTQEFEPAMRAARVAASTVGAALTLVLRPDGDPAGLGEDAAADATSDRFIFMDQSVLPRDPDWALRHTALLADAPAEQTKVMGGLLYDPDGSLSHAGYYLDQQTSVRTRSLDTPRRLTMLRVNNLIHPAPLSRPAGRPATGVSGAFLSVDRAWFEKLGGFTRQYSRAAHEDIDFCLRSLKQGVPAWVHPIAMWHFERRSPIWPEPSKGGAILNAWLLDRLWRETIVPDLLGPSPALPGGGT